MSVAKDAKERGRMRCALFLESESAETLCVVPWPIRAITGSLRDDFSRETLYNYLRVCQRRETGDESESIGNETAACEQRLETNMRA